MKATIFAACLGATFLAAVVYYPAVSQSNEEAYFSFISHPDEAVAGFYYDLGFDAFGAVQDAGRRVDVPVWFVDLCLLLCVAGAARDAYREHRRTVRTQTGDKPGPATPNETPAQATDPVGAMPGLHQARLAEAVR